MERHRVEIPDYTEANVLAHGIHQELDDLMQTANQKQNKLMEAFFKNLEGRQPLADDSTGSQEAEHTPDQGSPVTDLTNVPVMSSSPNGSPHETDPEEKRLSLRMPNGQTIVLSNAPAELLAMTKEVTQLQERVAELQASGDEQIDAKFNEIDDAAIAPLAALGSHYAGTLRIQYESIPPHEFLIFVTGAAPCGTPCEYKRVPTNGIKKELDALKSKALEDIESLAWIMGISQDEHRRYLAGRIQDFLREALTNFLSAQEKEGWTLTHCLHRSCLFARPL